MKYLLRYEDAQEITQKYNNKNFYETQYIKDGYKVCSFNYWICGWYDFFNPLPNSPEVDAFDMRGTTFVFDKDGEYFARYFMLPKFFNLNQVDETQYSKVQDKIISCITEKEDGSLIAFMGLPNGKIFSKTIGSFVSDQSESAFNLLYTDEEHVIFVKHLIERGFTPLFEYVSWENRIVLKYGSPSLRFIGIRSNITGKFYSVSEINEITNIIIPSSLSTVNEVKATLDELIERCKTEENKEGYVIKFFDGTLIKIKTDWYFKLHGIRTDNIFREDYVAHHYINDTLDDLVTLLNPEEDKDAFNFIGKVSKAIDNYIEHINFQTSTLKERFRNEFDSNWVAFATSCHKEPFFGLVKTRIEKPEEYKKRLTELVINRTSHLKESKELIEKWTK
jgi:T4 RnlA family RNA ligase